MFSPCVRKPYLRKSRPEGRSRGRTCWHTPPIHPPLPTAKKYVFSAERAPEDRSGRAQPVGHRWPRVSTPKLHTGSRPTRQDLPDTYDDDGLRERADVRESEARRRERDRAEARAEEASREAGRDVVRADLREGRISREDFARLAREAGISAREVAATLREHRPAAPAPAPSPSAAARSLATAAAAKARGVEELRRGETAEAAATFSRAAELALG